MGTPSCISQQLINWKFKYQQRQKKRNNKRASVLLEKVGSVNVTVKIDYFKNE